MSYTPRFMTSCSLPCVTRFPAYITTPCAPTGRRQPLVHHSFRRPRVRSSNLFAGRCKSFSIRPSCVRSELSKTPRSKKVVDRDFDPSRNAKSTQDNGIPLDSTCRNDSSTLKEIQPEKLETRDSPVPDGNKKENGAIQVQLFGMPISIPARWLLFSVPFMWGSFGPAVRLIFSQEPHLEPSVFNTARLLMSSTVYLPILLTEFSMYQKSRSAAQASTAETNDDKDRYSFVKAGIELGIYVFLANVAQVIGLQEVSAARAAFLVQLQTVIVPVLSGVLGLEAVGRKTWISSIIAVAGVALLSLDKGHGAISSLYGDGLEILSAFFFSTYVIRLGRYCNTVRSGPLVATKILVQAVLSSAWAFSMTAMATPHTSSAVMVGDSPIPEWTLPILGLNIGVVAWTGLISSAASGWAQTKGQQKVPASDAVVIFATQPLWASAIAAVLLGESFGPRGVVGGCLIVASTLVASVKGSADSTTDSSEEGDK